MNQGRQAESMAGRRDRVPVTARSRQAAAGGNLCQQAESEFAAPLRTNPNEHGVQRWNATDSADGSPIRAGRERPGKENVRRPSYCLSDFLPLTTAHFLGERFGMSFSRHGEIYQSDGLFGRSPGQNQTALRPGPHRLDEFRASYSLAGWSPPEPASASLASFHSGKARNNRQARPPPDASGRGPGRSPTARLTPFRASALDSD